MKSEEITKMYVSASKPQSRNDGNSELVSYYLQQSRKMSNSLGSITTHLKSANNYRSMKKRSGIIKSLIERNQATDEKISSESNSRGKLKVTNQATISSFEPFSSKLKFNGSIEIPMQY